MSARALFRAAYDRARRDTLSLYTPADFADQAACRAAKRARLSYLTPAPVSRWALKRALIRSARRVTAVAQ